jgi:UDP-N-acetylmuramoylalanine--D-glutamate ligase
VEDIRGKRFAVIGGARSGLAVAILLKAQGAEAFLSELAPAEKMAEVRSQLEAHGIPYEFGGHTSRVYNADGLVLSPGVPSDAAVVQEALRRDCWLVSELEVASWLCKGPVVAITGTNGKTTATTLTGRLFADAGVASVVAGNIGTAFSEVVDTMPQGGTAIVEVSSFQLDHIWGFRPKVAVLLNITPDHLDRYEHSFEKYVASKCRIFENQSSGDILIYNDDDETTRTNVQARAGAGVQLLPFSRDRKVAEGAYIEDGLMVTSLAGRTTEVLPAENVSIPGHHNLSNAMAATLVGQVMGISGTSIRATLESFRGVEHRLESVRRVGGVHYVNDSKATNVESVWYALQSFSSPIVLLLGGRDKGNDYSRLQSLVRDRCRAIVAIGESSEKVRGSFEHLVPVQMARTMEDAVNTSARYAHPGDTVLLSPACASFDWFDDYEHRGRVFKSLVLKLVV